jgi:hypothetical protein
LDGASGGSVNNIKSDLWCKQWLRAIEGATDGASDFSGSNTKVRAMVLQAMDQRTIEGAMDCASGGSGKIEALGNGSYKKVCGFRTFVHTMWKGTKLHREFTMHKL